MVCLAKRTRERFRVDRQAKQASHSGDEDLRWHDCVLAVGGRGKRGDPRVGVLAIESLEALLVTRGALGNQAVQGSSIDQCRGRALVQGTDRYVVNVEPTFAALHQTSIPTVIEGNWAVISYLSDPETAKASRHTGLIVSVGAERVLQD